MFKSMNFALSATLSMTLIGATLSSMPTTAIAAGKASKSTQATGVLVNSADVVPEIVALGLQPQVYKVKTSQLQNLYIEQDKYVLQINIGRVTAEQFAKLHAMYGGQSKVAYNPNKAYELVDFLPPVIQATVNKTFSSTHYDTSALSEEFDMEDENMSAELYSFIRKGASFSTNCWNTSMEVVKFLRDPQLTSYTLTWPDRWSADEVLKSDDYSKMVRTNQLRFGDMMLVSNKDGTGGIMLQHTAIILGDNLVFEKTDSSENDPYRLSLKTDVLAKYKELLGSGAKIQFRRFSADKKELSIEAPIPEPFEAVDMAKIRRLAPEIPLDHLLFGCETGLGGGCDLSISEIRTVQLTIDSTTGRGKLVGAPDVIKRLKPLE